MGTASEVPISKPPPASSRCTALFQQKHALTSMQNRLLEAKALAAKRLPARTMKDLNERLWDAFVSRDTDEMVRLVKAGANPNSIGFRLDRQILDCEY